MSARSAHIALPILLQFPERTLSVTTIIDSGACSCFIDLSFAAQQHIPLQPKTQGLSVFLADGSCIKSGLVTKETPLLLTVTAPNHQELTHLPSF